MNWGHPPFGGWVRVWWWVGRKDVALGSAPRKPPPSSLRAQLGPLEEPGQSCGGRARGPVSHGTRQGRGWPLGLRLRTEGLGASSGPRGWGEQGWYVQGRGQEGPRLLKP